MLSPSPVCGGVIRTASKETETMEHGQCLTAMSPLVGAVASAGLGGIALTVAAIKRGMLPGRLARWARPNPATRVLA